MATVSLVLLLAGIGVAVALGGVMPLPYGAAADIVGYVHDHHGAVQAGAVGAFAASVPLTIYVATVSTRLRQLGVTAPGATIALAGGILATGALALAGLICWTMSRPEVVVDDGLIRALYYLVFLTGGVGHIVALGLLVAGIAVPSLVLGLLPRAVAWGGLAIATLAEFATVVLIWPETAVVLPIARLTGLVWLIVAGALLPQRRTDRRRA